ncbi:MAG: hypothetical protein V1735_03090 [Nanoarchaeota archaeon]
MARPYQADLHLHSSGSDTQVPKVNAYAPLTLFRKTINDRGMDFFTLTDHDTMKGFYELLRGLPEDERGLAVPGVELTVEDPAVGHIIHVAVWMPREMREGDPETIERRCESHLSRMKGLSVRDLLSYGDDHGLFLGYNHPFWFDDRVIKEKEIDVTKVPNLAKQFRIIEVVNGGGSLLERLGGIALALDSGLGMYASSDSHSGDIGHAYTVVPATTVLEFFEEIYQGKGRPIIDRRPYEALLEDVLKYQEILHDRLLLRRHWRLARTHARSTQDYRQQYHHEILQVIDDCMDHGEPFTIPPDLEFYNPRIIEWANKIVTSDKMRDPNYRERMRIDAKALARFMAKRAANNQGPVQRDVRRLVHGIIRTAHLRIP